MGEFPNKATQFKTGTQAVEKGRVGGQQSTPEKKLAARIRELKKKGLKDDTAAELVQLMESHDVNALDILIMLKQLQGKTETFDQTINLIRARLEHHEKVHGQRIRMESKNVNVNVDLTVSDVVIQNYEKRMAETQKNDGETTTATT